MSGHGAAFLAAIDEISLTAVRLLDSLQTSAPLGNREQEIAPGKARAAQRHVAVLCPVPEVLQIGSTLLL